VANTGPNYTPVQHRNNNNNSGLNGATYNNQRRGSPQHNGQRLNNGATYSNQRRGSPQHNGQYNQQHNNSNMSFSNQQHHGHQQNRGLNNAQQYGHQYNSTVNNTQQYNGTHNNMQQQNAPQQQYGAQNTAQHYNNTINNSQQYGAPQQQYNGYRGNNWSDRQFGNGSINDSGYTDWNENGTGNAQENQQHCETDRLNNTAMDNGPGLTDGPRPRLGSKRLREGTTETTDVSPPRTRSRQ
jgi:hypothetical protein